MDDDFGQRIGRELSVMIFGKLLLLPAHLEICITDKGYSPFENVVSYNEVKTE